jgi:hypothetical protein
VIADCDADAALPGYFLSDVHELSPHSHRNMWKVRPDFGSSMLVMKRGCLPQRVQGGEEGCSGIRLSRSQLRLYRRSYIRPNRGDAKAFQHESPSSLAR